MFQILNGSGLTALEARLRDCANADACNWKKDKLRSVYLN